MLMTHKYCPNCQEKVFVHVRRVYCEQCGRNLAKMVKTHLVNPIMSRRFAWCGQQISQHIWATDDPSEANCTKCIGNWYSSMAILGHLLPTNARKGL